MIKWFIGYDKDESIAAYVLAHSLQSHSSMPISFTFIDRLNLNGIFTRKRSDVESTDFSISRFMVPYLSKYSGWSIFSDCDMVCVNDPAKLWAWRDDDYALMCVKHNYQPTENVKFLGNQQLRYEKKNWSSVILFNNAKCKALTPDYVNSASGLDLHQFKWTDDTLIGEIPRHWNHLVGHDTANPSLIHYTLGGPYFKDYENVDFSDAWSNAKTSMEHVKNAT